MPDLFNDTTQPNTSTPPPVAQPVAPLTPAVVKKHVRLFTTFCQNPLNISFAEQEDDETIILFLRRDFITNVPWIIASVGLAFVPYLIRFIFISTSFSL